MAKAKEYFEKAKAIKTNSTKAYREWSEKARREIEKAKFDLDLSPQGREKKVAELRKKYGLELMQSAYRLKDEYQTWVERAKKAAKDELYDKLKKPAAEKIDRFNRDFKRFKTDLMLTPRVSAAEQKLNAFIASIDDPYLANEVPDQFDEIAGTILNVAGNESPQYRLKLSQTYQQLQDNFMSDDAKEAKKVIESLADDEPVIFNPVVGENASDLLGGEYAKYINEPEAFFEKEENAKYKPEPYQDELNSPDAMRKQALEDATTRQWREIDEQLNAAKETLEAWKKLQEELAGLRKGENE